MTTPRLGISYGEALGFLIGGTSVTVVGTAEKASASFLDVFASASLGKKIVLSTAGLAMAGAGVAIGYYIGFDDRVRCGDSLFQQLLDDPVFWGGVAEDFSDDHRWTVTYADQLTEYDELMNHIPAWAKGNDDGIPYDMALAREGTFLKSGLEFMRILPFKDRPVAIKDLLSEARLAGVLDTANPLGGKNGRMLSPLILCMISKMKRCNPCLPEHIASFTDGVPTSVDTDIDALTERDLWRIFHAHSPHSE